MPSRIELAAWALDLDVPVAASLYSLPEENRMEGARVAHEANCWLHMDVILTGGEAGIVTNDGVPLTTIRRVLEQLPGARVDVHLMVIGSPEGWRDEVSRLARELMDVGVARWSARPEILELVGAETADEVERWVEYWPPRDGPEWPSSAGTLIMLIEPGSRQHADADVVRALEGRPSGATVGVDGGVTRAVATGVVAGGGSYLVIGRALFERGGQSSSEPGSGTGSG